MKAIIILIFSFGLNSFSQTDNTINCSVRDSVTKYATGFIGTPYLYGGGSKKGFDCSGLVHHVYTHFNYSVPRTSRGFGDVGVEIEKSEASPGDIIIFSGTKSKKEIGHVGIIHSIDEDEIVFIHSSSSKKHNGVILSNLETTGYKERFIKIIRIIKC